MHALPLEPQSHVHPRVFPAFGSMFPGSGFLVSETQVSEFRRLSFSGFGKGLHTCVCPEPRVRGCCATESSSRSVVPASKSRISGCTPQAPPPLSHRYLCMPRPSSQKVMCKGEFQRWTQRRVFPGFRLHTVHPRLCRVDLCMPRPSSQSLICKGEFQRWTFRVQVSGLWIRGSGFRLPGFGFCTPVHAQTLEPEGDMQRRVPAVDVSRCHVRCRLLRPL